MEGNSTSTLEAQAIGEAGGEPATGAVKQNTTPFFSQSGSMVTVFGERNGRGNLQMVKKVVTAVDQYKDYIGEIQQRKHTRPDGTFVTHICVPRGSLYVLDDITTMQVTGRQIATDGSKLVYFAEGNDGSGVALQGDRGPSGVRGLKGDSGGQGPIGNQGPAGKRGAVWPGGPPGKFGKIASPGPIGSKGNVGVRGEKVTREMLMVLNPRTCWK